MKTNDKDTYRDPFIDDEIDLREVAKALKRQKRFILVFTGVFVLLGLILALTLPNVYRINVILQVPEVVDPYLSPQRSTDDKEISRLKRPLDPASVVKAKIEKGVYLSPIVRKFSFSDPDKVPKFQVEVLGKDERYLEISLKSKENDVKRDVRILKYLVAQLNNEYQPRVDFAKRVWEEITSETRKYSKSISKELRLTTDERDSLFASQAQKSKEATATAFSELTAQILSLSKALKQAKIELKILSHQKDSIHNFIETQPVSVSLKPISPHRRVIFVIMSLLGLFLSVFIALIRDGLATRSGEG